MGKHGMATKAAQDGACARKALSALLSLALVCAYGLPAEAFAAATAGDGDAATDITQQWRDGALTLSEAGTYVLSGDVQTDGTLTVCAAAGETITVDFSGYSATVAGAVFAGIDASGSEGTVIVTDSTYGQPEEGASEDGGEAAVEADAEEAEDEEETATLAVRGEGVADAVAGILANYVSLDDGEAGDAPVLEVSGVSVEVELASAADAEDGTEGDEESDDTADDADAAEDADDEDAAAGDADGRHDAYAVYVGYEDEDDARGELAVALEDVTLGATVGQPVDGDGADGEDGEADADGADESAGADADGDEEADETLADDEAGVAYGVYTTAGGVALDGTLAVETASDYLTCGLYATVEGAFAFGAGFELAGATRVYAAGNEAGTVFATLDEELSLDDETLALFEDASDEGTVLEADGLELVFAQGDEAAAGDGAAADGGSSGGADAAGSGADGDGQDAASEDGGVTALLSSLAELLSGWVAVEASDATVSFDANGGSGSMDSVAASDGTVTLPACTFTYEGYDFAGWSTAADGSGTSYEDGATLEGLEEDVTLYAQWESHHWEVTAADGTTTGSYASFDDAEDALESGGTVTLLDSQSGETATFDKDASGSYTIDLAGNTLGSFTDSSAADVELVSSVEGGTIDSTACTPSVATTYCYAVFYAGAGDLTVSGIDIELDTDYQSYWTNWRGVDVAGSGQAVLEDVSVDGYRRNYSNISTSAGILVEGGASLAMEGCSVSFAYATSYALYLESSSSCEASGCDIEHTRWLYSMSSGAVYVGSGAEAAFSGCTVTASMSTSTSGTSSVRGIYNAGSLSLEACSVSATSVSGTKGYGLYESSSSAGVELDGACSIYGDGCDFWQTGAATLGAGFSSSSVIGVCSESAVTQDVFADLESGADGEALAAYFEPTDDSYYATYELVVSSDGTQLEWYDGDTSAIDLYELVTDDDGQPISSSVTLTHDREYYLSQSVADYTSSIKMTYDGEYAIDLRGNTIGATFSVDGDDISLDLYSTDGAGSAKQGTIEGSSRIIFDASGSLSISNIDYRKTSKISTSLTTSVPVYIAGAASIEIDSCSFEVYDTNYGIGASRSTNQNVTAMRIEGTATKVSMTDTSISATATETTCDAVALYLIAKGNGVTLEDCSLSASSVAGNAIALFRDKYYTKTPAVTLSGETSLAATGASGMLSVGALNVVLAHGTSGYASETDGPAMVLDGAVSFTTSATSNAVALASDQQTDEAASAPFELGASFEAETPLTIACGLEYTGSGYNVISTRPYTPYAISEDANTDGDYAAYYADDVSDDAKETLAAQLANGNASCNSVPTAADDGVWFDDASLPYVAQIERDGETLQYKTLEKAAYAAADGETVEVIADISDHSYVSESDWAEEGSLSYTIDLAGHTLTCITCETTQDVSIVDSVGGATVTGYYYRKSSSSASTYGIEQLGTGSLSLEGIEIAIENVTSSYAYGVYASAYNGSVVLDGCSISIDTGYSATGVYVKYAGLAADDTTVEVVADRAATALATAASGSSYTKVVALSGCSLSAEAGTTAYAASIAKQGAFSATDTELEASGDAAYALYSTANIASASLDGCTLQAAGETTWCAYVIGNDTLDADGAPRLTLDGTMSFDSDTGEHVFHSYASIGIGTSFELAEDGADQVVVYSSNLNTEDDVFAQPADEGESLAELTSLFSADSADGCEYAAYEVAATDDGCLQWNRGIVAELTHTSTLGTQTVTEYKSLNSALDAAQSGDSIVMVDDSAEVSLTADCAVSIDLAGYEVDVTSSSYGLELKDGRTTIADSEGGGVLSVAYTGTGSGGALRVWTGAGVTLDGCEVEVTHAGSEQASNLYGVYVFSTSITTEDDTPAVLMGNGATLSVASRAQGASCGATQTYGIYVSTIYSDDVAGVEVQEGSCVNVGNEEEVTEKSASSNPLSDATIYLRELDVDENSDLYAEIAQDFLWYASYDALTSVYYLCAHELSDGTWVWAFSDYTYVDEVGKSEYITPDNIYVLSGYETAPDAVGITDSGNSSGSVLVEGAVDVTSANGNAYAVAASSLATYEIDGATLSATSYGTESYWALSNAEPSIGDVGSVPSDYDDSYSYRLVYDADPQAAAVFMDEQTASAVNKGYSQATFVLDGEVELSADALKGVGACVLSDEVQIAEGFVAEEGCVTLAGMDGVNEWGDAFAVSADGETAITEEQAAAFADAVGDFEPALADDGLSVTWEYASIVSTVTVTFSGAKDEDGNSLDSVSVSLLTGSTLDEESAALAPAASDYGTYVFVGWRVGAVASTGVTIIDPACLMDYEFTSNTTLNAHYVKVTSSQQLVVFKADELLYPYAVSDGGAVTFSAAQTAMGVGSAYLATYPSRTDAGTWEFAGWASGYYSDTYALTAADYGPDDTLPSAAGGEDTAWYTAYFSGDATPVSSVTLHYYSWWSDSEWSYGSTTLTLADGTDIDALTSGDTIVDGDVVDCVVENSDGTWSALTFLGWSSREEDVLPLSDLPLVGDGIDDYYAIYSESDMQVEVTFHGDDGESCTVTVGSTASVADAMEADGYAELTAPAGYELKAWAYEEGVSLDDEDAVFFRTFSMVDVYEAETLVAPTNGEGDTVGTADYYAVWSLRDPVDVVLHTSGGTWPGGDESDEELEATPGLPLSSSVSMDGYAAPYLYGSAFTGWNFKSDGTGSAFDLLSDPVEDDGMDLWAQYAAFELTGAEDGAAADASTAYINSEAAVGADSVAVSFVEADDADGAISISSVLEEIQAYNLSVTVVRNGTSAELTSGFGTLELAMPVPEEYAERDLYAYALLSDGSATRTALETYEDGDGQTWATLSVSSYGASVAGNIVLTYLLSDDEINLALAKSQAISQLNELYLTYDQDDYEGDEGTLTWGELCSYYEAGLAAIRAATSVDEVAEAYDTAASGMASVETKAGLATAIAESLESLAESYASYDSTAYSSSSWAKLVAAYEEAKEAIKNASTISEARAAATAGILAMAKITADASSSSSSSSSSSGSSTRSSSSSLGSSSSTSTSSKTATASSSLSSGSSSATGASGLSSSGAIGLSSGAESMLGGTLATVTAAVAEKYALAVTSGVLVTDVEEGGALDAVGIEAGDVITAVDGVEITCLEDLEEYLAGKEAGDTVQLTVNRGGEEALLTITLADAGTSDADEDADDEEEATGIAAVGKWIGNHAGQLVVVLLLILFLVGLIVGLLLRRRKKDDEDDDDGDDDDGFWDEDV